MKFSHDGFETKLNSIIYDIPVFQKKRKHNLISPPVLESSHNFSFCFPSNNVMDNSNIRSVRIGSNGISNRTFRPKSLVPARNSLFWVAGTYMFTDSKCKILSRVRFCGFVSVNLCPDLGGYCSVQD